MNNIIIRPISPSDNESLGALIRQVLLEMNVPKVGTAYEDKSLDKMYETYANTGSRYYVVENNNTIVGGAGIAPLEGKGSKGICELQKMYFLSEIRGKGLGAKMIYKCFSFAKEIGYEQCYLETMPYMKAAIKLYEKVGFLSLDEPVGDTGHYSCKAWMIKKL